MCSRFCLLMLLMLGGCSCRKTDAQRAAEERSAMQSRLRDSLTLFPYRLLKLSMRSRGSENRPEAVDAIAKVIDETRALPETVSSPAEAAKVAAVYGKLFVALAQARQSMKDRDEDEFAPLLALQASALLPNARYGNEEEHLLLAALFYVLDEAEQSNRFPGQSEIVFYELSRATPQPGWPLDLTQLVLVLRGGAFHAAGSYYAAEEELSSAIAALAAADSREELRAAAYFLRALNRQSLGRDEGVTEDLEALLASLQRSGFDNELTWWAQAMVSSRRGRFAEAAEAIDRLATSSNLDETSQLAMLEAATSMRETGTGIPVLLQAQASAILVRALIARAGGLERVLALIIGPELAHQALSPIQWLDRTRKQFAPSTPSLNAIDFVKARWRDAGHTWP